MPASGGEYLTSKDGILKVVIIIFGVISFALTTVSGYRGALGWPFAAFLMSWVITLFVFFFILVNLISKMDCGVPFEAVDFCFSFIFFVFCMSGSIVLSIYGCSGSKNCDERIAATIFGFLTAILYFVEMYFHKDNAPEPLKYLTKVNGIVKIVVVTLGCIAFALLVAGGYHCGRDSPCTSGRTFALATYIICWSVSVIFLLIYITGLNEKIGGSFATADFVWAVFSFVFCLTASIVLACYIDSGGWSRSRLIAADVFGFFTTVAYLIEAILLKKSSGSILPS
ncbi:myeloid-associated differentiation marker homolog [Styela clava]